MLITGTMPVKPIEQSYDTEDQAAALKRFLNDHPGVRPETIDGEVIRGICACGTPITMNEKSYSYDPVSGYICPDCVIGDKA